DVLLMDVLLMDVLLMDVLLMDVLLMRTRGAGLDFSAPRIDADIHDRDTHDVQAEVAKTNVPGHYVGYDGPYTHDTLDRHGTVLFFRRSFFDPCAHQSCPSRRYPPAVSYTGRSHCTLTIR
ncbi:MAG: hypothetical protein QF879_15515, partial [Candidatus Latescibacteria bacterium]|nr:hypothetical protein [Candidatus Latescibacterota bacterium]